MITSNVNRDNKQDQWLIKAKNKNPLFNFHPIERSN